MIGQRQDFVFAEQHGRLKRPLTAPWWEWWVRSGEPLTCVTQILITQYRLVLQQYNKNVPSVIRNPINKSSFSEASWFMFGGQQSSEFPGLVWFAVANCPGGDSLCQLAGKYIITELNLFCWKMMMMMLTMMMMMATVCRETHYCQTEPVSKHFASLEPINIRNWQSFQDQPINWEIP